MSYYAAIIKERGQSTMVIKARKYRVKAQIKYNKKGLDSSIWIQNHLPCADLCIMPAGISRQIAPSFTD